MAYANVVRLKRVQAGVEATRAVPATITRKVYGSITRTHNQEIEEIPDESGTFWGGEAVVAGDAEVGFTVEAIVSHEDLAWWLEGILAGGVAPVADAGSPIAYARTHVPSGTVDNLKTWTFEYGWGGLVYRSDMVHVASATIAVDRANARYWRLTMTLVARNVVKIVGFTAAIPDRIREPVLAPGTHLYIDNAGASLGATEILGKWRSLSFTVNNNPDHKRFGESDEFIGTDFGRGQQVVTGEVVLEHTDDIEYEKQRIVAARRIRIEKAGSIIHDAVAKRVRVDIGNAYWNAPAENPIGQNLAQSFGFIAKPLAGAAPISIETINALATLV